MKTGSSILGIAVTGIAVVISAVCVAGMLATEENVCRTPEELRSIPLQELSALGTRNFSWRESCIDYQHGRRCERKRICY